MDGQHEGHHAGRLEGTPLWPRSMTSVTVHGACFWPPAEQYVEQRIADLRQEFADVLAEPGGFLREICRAGRYAQLHSEIDELYRRLLGTTSVELDLACMTDRERAQVKLAFLSQVIEMQRCDEACDAASAESLRSAWQPEICI